MINFARLFNLFSFSTKHNFPDIHPTQINAAILFERQQRITLFKAEIEKISPKIKIAGKDFYFLLTSSSGIHSQKFVYASNPE